MDKPAKNNVKNVSSNKSKDNDNKLQVLELVRNINGMEIASSSPVLINAQIKKSDFIRTKECNNDLLQAIENVKMSNYIIENKQDNKERTKLTKCIAMDCEMVGIGDGNKSMIARVSIVNEYGVCIYDKYVKPTETVKNYRTPISGIRPHHLKNGEDFKVVRKEVADILKGRLLIGHALHNDLNVLFLFHPNWHQRDTSTYFRQFTKGRTPSLKSLAAQFLDLHIQTGEHNSIEDAKTTMLLYKLFKKQWEDCFGII